MAGETEGERAPDGGDEADFQQAAEYVGLTQAVFMELVDAGRTAEFVH